MLISKLYPDPDARSLNQFTATGKGKIAIRALFLKYCFAGGRRKETDAVMVGFEGHNFI